MAKPGPEPFSHQQRWFVVLLLLLGAILTVSAICYFDRQSPARRRTGPAHSQGSGQS